MTRKSLGIALFLMAAASLPSAALAGAAKASDDKRIGDWVLHCTKLGTGEKACALHQRIIAKETGLPVASFAIARNKDSHELRLAVVLPLGLDIPAGVSGKAGAVPLTFTTQTCLKRGCISSLTVDDRLLESLHGSETLSTTFRMRGVQDAVILSASLKGLDEGLKALEAQ